MPRRSVANRKPRRASALAALLLVTAALVGASVPARAADPARVTLDGEWQLDRSEHDPCSVVVPPVLSGTMHLEADFERGTVEGWLRGDGSGSYTLPPACDRLNPTEYELARPETYQAEFPVVEMTFSGRLDSGTGEFAVEGALWVEGSGSHAAPDYQYSCVPGGLTTSCPLYEFRNDWTGTISGAVQGTGVNQGEIDWPIPYCAAISPTEQGSTDDWGADSCPTLGEWQATVTEVVWQENEPPLINGIGATPAEPTSNDTVVIAVDATDPDDDPLTYAWYIDGAQTGGNAASQTWTNPTPGSHQVRVTVSDGVETVEATLDDFVVANAGTADPGDAGGVVPGDDGQDAGSPGSVSTVPQNPFAEDGQDSSAALPWASGKGGGWSPLGVAILILFLILALVATGLAVKAAVAQVLGSSLAADLMADRQPPTPGETATLAREVQAGLSGGAPMVTVTGPVQPWSGPDAGAPRADFVLQPGQAYDMLGALGTGPDAWVQVRQGGKVGWVHRSTLQAWHQEVIVRPHPPGSDYREAVSFPEDFDTRQPGGGNCTRRDPGNYQLGPPNAAGQRPVYDQQGTLIGTMPADKVPPSSLRQDVAPPPPPPAPPTP